MHLTCMIFLSVMFPNGKSTCNLVSAVKHMLYQMLAVQCKLLFEEEAELGGDLTQLVSTSNHRKAELQKKRSTITGKSKRQLPVLSSMLDPFDTSLKPTRFQVCEH